MYMSRPSQCVPRRVTPRECIDCNIFTDTDRHDSMTQARTVLTHTQVHVAELDLPDAAREGA